MDLDDLTFAVLKTKQRRLRERFSSDLDLRIHRAISWVRGAERAISDKDSDTAFICYWIAFNAAYAQGRDLHARFQDTDFREWYFALILSVDSDAWFTMRSGGASPTRYALS